MSASETSPSGFSPESSALRFSCDTRCTISTKNGCNLAWWFEDLSVLNFDKISKAISCMVSKKLEHASISRFLFYFLKHRYLNATSDEKRQATEIVVDLLHSLEVYFTFIINIYINLAKVVEKDCRICHLGLQSAAYESGIAIELGCSCKGDLASAHKLCAEKWRSSFGWRKYKEPEAGMVKKSNIKNLKH